MKTDIDADDTNEGPSPDHEALDHGAPRARLGDGGAPATAQRLITWLTVGGASAFVFWQLSPAAILANTTPTGGDMGAHVWGPWFLRHHLLNHGQLSGWSPDWFAGFPAFRFYMVLPALMIALLSFLLPYGIAFKLVTVAGVVSLPVCAYSLGRMFGTRFPEPQLLALATLPFLFDTSYAIYGGNIESTLAGEFAFALSLSFGLLALGCVARGLETGRYRIRASVLLALTVLCHVIPALFCATGCLVLLALRADTRRLRWAASTGVTALLLACFWLMPFVGRHAWFNDMGWVKLDDPGKALIPHHLQWALFFAAIGIVGAFVRMHRLGVFLAAMGALTAIAFVALPEGALWNARLLPFWYLVVYLLAGLGIAAIGRSLAAAVDGSGEGARLVTLATPVVAAVVVIIGVALPLDLVPGHSPTPAEASPVRYWPQANFGGYERVAAYPEYRALVDTMRNVGRREGCGRALWEFAPDLSRYGTTMAPMLLPYWTDGCIGSMEGLYMESTLTSPFHWLLQSTLSATPSRPQRDLPYGALDVRLGVSQMQLMGIRYYMAFSPTALAAARTNPDLLPLASSGPWQIFRVRDSQLVTGLAALPVVFDSATPWRAAAIDWYQHPARWHTMLARSGPRGWPRAKTGEPLASGAVAPATVTHVRTDDDSVSFDVDRRGVPVLVKISAFPNWRVDGAHGPWQVAPNFMVVVPTREHVVVRYGTTTLDLAANLFTFLGIVIILVLFLKPMPPLPPTRRRWFEDEGGPPWLASRRQGREA